MLVYENNTRRLDNKYQGGDVGQALHKGYQNYSGVDLIKISEGATVKQLLEDYPHLTEEGIYACVDYERA